MPMRRPLSEAISATFDLGTPLRPVGAHITTKFRRRIATELVSGGMVRSPRATARSALPEPSRLRLCSVPSVSIGVSRTAPLFASIALAMASTSVWSSLPAGPTAMRSVAGCQSQ